MARVEAFTYAGYTVGGAAPTAPTQVMGRFGWDFDAGDQDETQEFVSDFFLVGSSRADLEAKTATMLAALRTRYSKLSVDWGATNVASYDPAVANATGFEPKPSIRKSRNLTSTGFMRGFEFRVRVQIPSNYSDANLPGTPAAGGRRTSSVNLRWDVNSRRVVTIDGVFHEVPGTLPRALTTTSQTNHPDTTKAIDTYCLARLTKIDAAASWTISARDERDNNSQAILTFRREYSETIHGRVGSQVSVIYLSSRQRQVTIRGTYLRTYSTGVGTTGARANFLDGANGGYAFAVTQLAALDVAEGGALTVDTDCELVSESYPPNEQDDRVDYTLVFREIIWKQSNAASGLDDPDVAVDSVSYVLSYVPLDDSPVPDGGAGENPNPFRATPVGGGSGSGGKPAGTGAGTLDKSVVPPDGGGAPGTTSGTLPVKPVNLYITYKATLKKTVLDLKAKWEDDIKPWLLSQWAPELGFGPAYEVKDDFQESPDSNVISAGLQAVALPGDLLGYQVEEAVMDDLGKSFDKAATGTPYEYLVQDIFPERTKRRTHRAVYKTGSSFDPAALATQSAIPGYVVKSRSAPSIKTTVTGMAGLGIPTQSLTAIAFSEELIYVARNVGDGAPATGGGDNRTPTFSGLGVNPVHPENPGGV